MAQFSYVRSWLSRDPLGEYEGINLYGYVLNDPVNWTDPMGLCPAEGAAALGSSLGALAAEEEGGWAFGGNFNPAVDVVIGATAVGAAVYVGYEYLHPPTMPTVWDSKKQSERPDSGLINVPDEEISKKAHDNSLPSDERRRYQTEEKIRGLRNKQKRNCQ